MILFMAISSQSLKFSTNKNNKYLYEDESRPDFIQCLSVSNGQFCNLFDQLVQSAVIPGALSLTIRGIVGNQWSKYKVWCLCCGRYWPSDKQFSVPLYKKKSYIIPDVSALINFLNPYFTVFLGLYCRIPLLVLAGVICS